MGTITGQNILDRQRDLLQDVDVVRWSNTEVLRWLNDGIREAVKIKPTSYATRSAATLGAGTRQTLAGLGFTTGYRILDVTANLDTDGTTLESAITPADLRSLDRFEPSWRTKTGTSVKHWSPIPEDPKAFHVYPASSGKKVEVQVARTPPEMSVLSQAIPLDDIYANALGYYLAFRMYSKDTDEATNAAASQAYYTLFTQSLGG